MIERWRGSIQKSTKKCEENSQNIGFNIAEKQFEKYYQGRVFLDCHRQQINGKLMDWFLYDINHRHERVNMGQGRL